MLRRASATAIAAIIGDAEQDARKAIAELVAKKRCGPALLRLAFHDAATFDAATRTGGANASIRTKQELSHAGNESLSDVVEWLKPIAEASSRKLSLADVIQLAAAVVVESHGGPVLGFEAGRKDSWTYVAEGRLFDPRKAASNAAGPSSPSSSSTSAAVGVRRSGSGEGACSSPPSSSSQPSSPSAAAAAQSLREFASRLGMPLRHVVALAGAHPLGRWWADDDEGTSDDDANALKLPLSTAPPPGSPDAPRFSNEYFVRLLDGTLPPKALETDSFLLSDAETRLLVEEYKNSEATFFVDYAAAHDELSRLGMPLGLGGRTSSSGKRSKSEAAAGASTRGAATTTAAAAAAARRRRGPPPSHWSSWPVIDNLATILGVSPGTAAAASAAVGTVVVVGGAALFWTRRRRGGVVRR